MTLTMTLTIRITNANKDKWTMYKAGRYSWAQNVHVKTESSLHVKDLVAGSWAACRLNLMVLLWDLVILLCRCGKCAVSFLLKCAHSNTWSCWLSPLWCCTSVAGQVTSQTNAPAVGVTLILPRLCKASSNVILTLLGTNSTITGMHVNSNKCMHCTRQVLLCLTCRLYHICNVCFQVYTNNHNFCQLAPTWLPFVAQWAWQPWSHRRGCGRWRADSRKQQGWIWGGRGAVFRGTSGQRHSAWNSSPHQAAAHACCSGCKTPDATCLYLPCFKGVSVFHKCCCCCGSLPPLWMSVTAVDVCHCCDSLLLCEYLLQLWVCATGIR